MTKTGGQAAQAGGQEDGSTLRGIVISPSIASDEEASRPRISAFIWGGKVRPAPTLPFGRWKGAA